MSFLNGPWHIRYGGGLTGAGSVQKGRGIMMKARFYIGTFLFVMALSCSTLVQGAGVPPGSFITKSVSNPESLARLIEQDKKVGQRYSRHFGMTAKDMADYVRKNLKVSQLKTSCTFTTYYITTGDHILVHKKSFKAGRKVFVAPDGKPVLDVLCGNPMVRTLPRIVVKVMPKTEEIAVQPPPAAVETPPAVQPPVVAELPTTPPQFEAPAPVAPLPAPIPEVEVLNLPPTEFSSAASLFSNALLPGLLAVGAASAVLSGGKKSNDQPPVPEPSGLIILGSSSFTALVAGIRNRRRNSDSSTSRKR